MTDRFRARTGAFLLAAVLAGLGVLCLHSEPPRPAEPAAGPAQENDPMPTVQDRPATRAPIPPIDAAAPAQTETATFALG